MYRCICICSQVKAHRQGTQTRHEDKARRSQVTWRNLSGPLTQDSSKGGAVETGCSDLYDVMY